MELIVLFSVVALASASAGSDGSHPTVPSSEFDCSAQANVDYFYADPAGSCDVFYRCISSNSLAYKYQCDPGLVFYAANQRCEYPSSVPDTEPCGTGDGSTSNNTLTTYDCTGLEAGFYTTEDCTSTYYNCDGTVTIATQQECSYPLVVNTEKDDCDWTYNVAACNAGGTTTTVVTNIVTCGVNCASLPAGYYTSPSDPCSGSYYYCDGVSSSCYPQRCPSGLVYDVTKGYCDWGSSVDACNP